MSKSKISVRCETTTGGKKIVMMLLSRDAYLMTLVGIEQMCWIRTMARSSFRWFSHSATNVYSGTLCTVVEKLNGCSIFWYIFCFGVNNSNTTCLVDSK